MDDNKNINFFDDDKKNVEQLSSLERQIVELVGKGKTLKLSEPTVIHVDEFVAKDVIDSVSVKDDGTIALQGSRIDGAGVRASFSLEGRDEYGQSDLDKVLDAVKWDEFERRREALKAVGYPYDFKPREDGSVKIPTVDESLYWGYAAGLISLKDAAEEFCRAGWTNFVDEEYTSAKFSQLNSQFGKLDADLRPLAVHPSASAPLEQQGQSFEGRFEEAFNAQLELRAKNAIHGRIINPWQRTFTQEQVDALNLYHQVVVPKTPAKEAFSRLLHEVSQEQDVALRTEKWLTDTAKELDDIAEGKVRNEASQLKR